MKKLDITKRPLKKFSLFIGFGLLTLSCFAQDQDSKSWTQEKANQWMKTGDWKKDLHAGAHPSVNAVEFAEQYHKNKMLWDKAFLFLGRKDLDTLSPGTYPIDGEKVFAIISTYNPKDTEQTRWESHRKYTDLHYVIRGKEKIGVADVSQAKVTEPYDQAKDIAHYESDGKYYIAEPGVFFLFFPQQAHRPGIKTEGDTSVKKLVIKIIVAK
jgi:biofilm protein TabA